LGDLSFANPTTKTVTLSPTPLYMAATNGHEQILSLLLEKGAGADFLSPTAVRNIGSPSSLVRRYFGLLVDDDLTGYSKNKPLRRDQNPPPHGWSCSWRRPLCAAGIKGRKDIMEALIRAGASPDFRQFELIEYFSKPPRSCQKNKSAERRLACTM
jgi:ankyrin repeat protein